MRFEHILQIYWTKGFFLNGQLFYFSLTFNDLITEVESVGFRFRQLLVKRFEFTFFNKTQKFTAINAVQQTSVKSLIVPLNLILSQITSVNTTPSAVSRLRIIKLYLVKTYRGRCHAIGKPVSGQRTWSNAWNSFNHNKTLRNFISIMSKILQKSKVVEKINFKVTKKKYGIIKKKKDTVSKKKHLWF